MRKIFALAIIALMAFSCTETVPEIIVEPSVEGSQLRPMTFSASSETGPASKAVIDGLSIKWQADDAISVFDVSEEPSNTRFDLTAGAGTTSGTFQCDEAPASEEGYYSLYPYSATASLEDGLIHGVTIPRFQVIPNGEVFNDPSAVLMAARTTDNSLNFKNICAYIKLTLGELSFIYPGVKEVIITANGKENLVGTFNVGFDKDNLPVIEDVEGTYIVSLSPAEGVLSPENTDTYYIAVMPQTLSEGFTITVVTSDVTRSRKVTKSVELKRGQILNLGMVDKNLGWDNMSVNPFPGSGSGADPYLISTFDHLKYIQNKMDSYASSQYATASYLQTEDIDCGGEAFPAIGTFYPFRGTYDGGGHKIFNYSGINAYYHASNTPYAGLFAICEKATFKNMVVEPSEQFTFTAAGGDVVTYYGAIVGKAYAEYQQYTTFENCVVNGKVDAVSSDNLYVGGLVGALRGGAKFIGCTNNATVIGHNVNVNASANTEVNVGGFIGFADFDAHGIIVFDRCRNNGSITAECTSDEGNAGGFIGKERENWGTGEKGIALHMTNCVNKGNVSATTNVNYSFDHHYGDVVFAGGFVGQHDSDGYKDDDGKYIEPYLYNCVNTGNITVYSHKNCYAGGFMGYCYDEDTSFRVCANYADITGTSLSDHKYIAGFCGYDPLVAFNLDFAYCLMKSGLKMSHDHEAGDSCYTECAAQDSISADDMNALVSHAPSGEFSYASWTGSDSTLDLNF